MIKKLFKKETIEDLIEILEAKTFNEAAASSAVKNLEINILDDKGDSLAHKMALKNRVESVIWLKKQGIDLNLEDKNGDTVLFLAIKKGYIELVKRLLEIGVNPNHTNKNRRIALQVAAREGQYDIYCILFPVTNLINNIDNNGQNILFDAVIGGNIRIIEEIVSNINIRKDLIDNYGKNVLSYESVFKDCKIAKLLLKEGVPPTLKDSEGKNFLFYLLPGNENHLRIFEDIIIKYPKILEDNDDSGNNLLIESVKLLLAKNSFSKKDILFRFIQILCFYKINTNQINKENQSALSLAIKSKNLVLIETLLSNEVNPNIVDEHGNSLLSNVAMRGKEYKELVLLLINYGADPNIKDEDGQTIIEKLIDAELHISNQKKVSLKIKRLIDEENGDYFVILEHIITNSEANLRLLNSQEDPCFFEPALYGNIEMVKLLLHYGADINQTNKDGLNILYVLMEKNKELRKEIEIKKYYSILKTLITLGADVNARDNYGGVVLHKAILENDTQTVKILIYSGSDLLAIDNRGRTIIHNCVWKNKISTFRFIYSINRTLLNVPDKFGVLPIHYAAFLGYADMVLEFIGLGAHVNSPTKKAPYILNFLKRFHKNLSHLSEKARNEVDKRKILVLVKNMNNEFEIETN